MGPLGRETDDLLSRVTREAGEKARAKAAADAANRPMPFWAHPENTRMLTSGILTGGSLFGGMGILPAAAIGSLPYAIPAAVKGARAAPHMRWAGKKLGSTNLTTQDILKALALHQAGTPEPSD
jgi:hypothetical protein